MLTQKKIIRAIDKTGLNRLELSIRIGINKNVINSFIYHPAELGLESKRVIKLCDALGFSKEEGFEYIKKAKDKVNKLKPIEEYIPFYPESIDCKDLCKITGLSKMLVMKKIVASEYRPSAKIASEDGDRTFTRIK